MNVAIITARGGSKRIPKKNIKLFLDKPIIAYVIEAALKSELFDEVMVSTDDQEIADIAIRYGAVVPFIRSKNNSDDFATTSDVLNEVLSQYQSIGKNIKYACCIYPTAPFIQSTLLKKAFELLIEKNYSTVFPIQRFSFPIQRALIFKEDKVAWMNPENASVRSQDLVKTFHDSGQFYFFNAADFILSKKIINENSFGIEISELEAQDIDTMEDWEIAEFKYQLMQSKNKE